MRRWIAVLCASAAIAWIPGSSSAETHFIEMHDNFYSPATLTVVEGDLIQWTNLGTMAHTVDQNEEDSCADLVGGVSSGTMLNGDIFVWVAAVVGEFYYHCDFHCPPMFGQLTITESTPVEASTWSTVKATYH
jgi:plastocyanin